MPKKSKVSVPATRLNTRPGEPKPVEVIDKFRCTRCGKVYKRQYGNFSPSRSPLFLKNGGYLPVCVTCADDLLEHYKHALGGEEAAMRRMCMKFDIYWHPDIYAMVYKASTTHSRFRAYLSKLNLKTTDKTFDDTLDEELTLPPPEPPAPTEPEDVVVEPEPEPEPEDDGLSDIPGDVIAFWGTGFDADYYKYVQDRYEKWTKDLPSDLPTSTEALYKQICMTEATIARDTIAGRETDKAKATLINLLGALNEKPVQKKQDEALDQAFGSTPFGVGIRMCENTRPIPKPDPELEDVDGIVRYITVWFNHRPRSPKGVREIYPLNCWKPLKPTEPQRSYETGKRDGGESRKNLLDDARLNPKHHHNGQSAAKLRTGEGSTTKRHRSDCCVLWWASYRDEDIVCSSPKGEGRKTAGVATSRIAM